jgi:hypothetical protein
MKNVPFVVIPQEVTAWAKGIEIARGKAHSTDHQTWPQAAPDDAGKVGRHGLTLHWASEVGVSAIHLPNRSTIKARSNSPTCSSSATAPLTDSAKMCPAVEDSVLARRSSRWRGSMSTARETISRIRISTVLDSARRLNVASWTWNRILAEQLRLQREHE